jgi:hypothetical protein
MKHSASQNRGNGFKPKPDDGISGRQLEKGWRMISMFRKQAGARIWTGALFCAGLGVASGCGDAFSGDCQETRSCAPPDESETSEAGQANSEPSGDGSGGTANGPTEVGAAGQGGAGGSADTSMAGAAGGGAAGNGAGGEPAGSCRKSVECNNGDPADGEELCLPPGVCTPGNAPPLVVSVTPEDGVDDAEPDAVVEVEFSEPLDPDSVSSTTFKVFAGDVEALGVVKLSSSRSRISFTPQDPFALYGSYRVEVSKGLKDPDGASMLDDFSSKFQVRDGVWSVVTQANAEGLQLPSGLPIAANGALLTTWLATDSAECVAQGTWVLRGQSGVSDAFESDAMDTECSLISASVAPGGDGAVGWVGSKRHDEWTQSFQGGAWSSSERNVYSGPGYVTASQVFAHDGGEMTVFNYIAYLSSSSNFTKGPARGDWTTDQVGQAASLTPEIAITLLPDGDGAAAWRSDNTVSTVAYDAETGKWASQGTAVPGVDAASNRSVLSIALSPTGEAMVVWLEGPTDSQSLRASHFTVENGWGTKPVTVSSSLGAQPLFDHPALVFDGQTFVTAWTAVTSGKLTTYSSRYDMDSGKWGAREPHLTDLGKSVALMPRLGVDAQRNLMLVWAIGDGDMSLVYQRYRAATDEWGSVEAIEDSYFADSKFASEGKLPFGFAPNGLGGVMFRDGEAGAQTLKLASFY